MARGKSNRPKQQVELIDKKARMAYTYEPYGEKRMNSQEREAFITLAGIKHYFVSGDMDIFNERADLYEYCKRDLALLKSLVIKVFFKLLASVPPAQVESLCRTCESSQVNVGTRMVAQSKRKSNDGYGLMISYSQLNTLIEYAQQQCMLCERDKCSENKCPLKQTFDAIGCDADHSRGCEYRYKWNEVSG